MLVRAAVVIPYIVPPAVTALLWLYMFDGNFGVVNDLLVKAGNFAGLCPLAERTFGQFLRGGGGDGLVWHAADGDRAAGRAADHAA